VGFFKKAYFFIHFYFYFLFFFFLSSRAAKHCISDEKMSFAMSRVFRLHPSGVLPPLYLFYIVTSEKEPAKRQMDFCVCAVCPF